MLYGIIVNINISTRNIFKVKKTAKLRTQNFLKNGYKTIFHTIGGDSLHATFALQECKTLWNPGLSVKKSLCYFWIKSF